MNKSPIDVSKLGFERIDGTSSDRCRVSPAPAALAVTPLASEPATVGVAGLATEGIAELVRLLRAGFVVYAYDPDRSVADAIRSGEIEIDLDDREYLIDAANDERCKLVESLAPMSGCSALVLCDPVIVDDPGPQELGPLRTLAHDVVRYLVVGQTVIFTASAFVGATRELVAGVLEHERGLTVGRDVFVATSPAGEGGPELPGLLDAGVRVVGGSTSECARRAVAVLDRTGQPLQVVDNPEAAELVGLLQYTFRSVNAALLGEFADVCRGVGLDVEALLGSTIELMVDVPPAMSVSVAEPSQRLLRQLRAASRPSPLIERAVASIGQRAAVIVDRVVEVLLDASIAPSRARTLVVGGSSAPGRGETGLGSTVRIIDELCARGMQVEFWDEHVRELGLPDGRVLRAVDDAVFDGYVAPDVLPLEFGDGSEASCLNVGDYDLVLVLSLPSYGQPSWLARAERVLDATYRVSATPHLEVV